MASACVIFTQIYPDTVERMEIIRDFASGEFDGIVGINLPREGLICRRFALVAIRRDKEGSAFLNR